LYKCADAFVFPSLYEGFGMPLIEAMGRQIPVICNDTTSLPEVTMSLANYYTPACDVRSLAQVMAEVLTHLPSSQYLKETADNVQKRYGIATVAKQYLDLWESLVE
jgi:glycosyltransferase involved in cell wall biosynthesis